MSRIAPAPTVTPYLALPPPSGNRAGVAGAAGNAAELQPTDLETLPPVPPVLPVTRRPPQADEDAKNENSGASGDAAASQAGAAPLKRRPTASATPPTGAPPQFALGTRSLRPSVGFIAQSLSQESIGAGLHIEPWRAALSSYRAAAALPGSSVSTQSLSV